MNGCRYNKPSKNSLFNRDRTLAGLEPWIRRDGKAMGIGAAFLVAATIILSGCQFSAYDEEATEACVAELVGHEVNLVPNRNGEPGLQHPASVFREQKACEEYQNNAILAKQSLYGLP